jgi:hypothetical protein
MTRVRIRGGWLNIGRRERPGKPTDPDWGVDEGEGGEGGEDGGDEGIDNELPKPPPGIWPPPTVGHPIHPIAPTPPGSPGTPGHLPAPPPGAIWPPVTSPVEGLFIVLAHIPEHGWHYIVVDPDAWPKPGAPTHPIAPGEPIPPREPKR